MRSTTGTGAADPGGDPPDSRPRDPAGRVSVWRRLAPAIGLTLLAPLIGEFLLGNVSITAILALFILASLYGCGALLIRESARRAGRGWPTMIVLGIAYALFEEGLVTQFLFNPSYHGLDLQGAAYVPALGIGVRVTVTIIALHAIWSTCVPIALVEALVPARSTTPWLGKTGFAITGVVFLLGSAYLFYNEYTGQGFLASPPQLVVTVLAIFALIAAAFWIGRRPRRITTGAVPNTWIVGTAALVTSSLLLLGLDAPGWVGVGIGLALLATSAVLVWHLSSPERWGAAHRLALAGGALLTYAWIGFAMPPLDEDPGMVDLIGNAVFATGAIVLLAVAIRSVRRTDQQA